MASGWGHRPHIPFGESVRQWLQHARTTARPRQSETLPSQVAEFRPRPLAPEPPKTDLVLPDLDDTTSIRRAAASLGSRGEFATVMFSQEGRVESLARTLATATSARVVDVSPSTEGWRLGQISLAPSAETLDQRRWLVTHPDQRPEGGESLDEFRRRWLGWFGSGPLRGGLADWGRVAIVTHSTNLRLLRDWIAVGCPATLTFVPESLVGDAAAPGPIVRVWRRPDASWQMDDFPAEGGPLPTGIYLVQHDPADSPNPTEQSGEASVLGGQPEPPVAPE